MSNSAPSNITEPGKDARDERPDAMVSISQQVMPALHGPKTRKRRRLDFFFQNKSTSQEYPQMGASCCNVTKMQIDQDADDQDVQIRIDSDNHATVSDPRDTLSSAQSTDIHYSNSQSRPRDAYYDFQEPIKYEI